MRRAADWKAAGYEETLADWASLNARSKFWGDDQRAAFKNWEEVSDPRNKLDGRQGVNERIMLRELLRRAARALRATGALIEPSDSYQIVGATGRIWAVRFARRAAPGPV